MRKFKISLLLILVSIIFILMGLATAQCEVPLKGLFFSTEEDFVTQGPVPSDGNPIISDGDLLNAAGYVYMRNYELLGVFGVKFDLGLDAVDVIDIEKVFVAFSTELDHPKGWFTAGDLLATNGAILPNSALLIAFDIRRELDLGLDAVHFMGKRVAIIEFLEMVKKYGRKYWLENPKELIEYLEKYDIDIWFSTEGTAPWPKEPRFLDGDLLSAATGTIVADNSDLLPPSVPAGIPERGVDFGLDAVTLYKEKNIEFSTEILYENKLSFTDGDVLLQDYGVTIQNIELIKSFEPKVEELGLDALSIRFTLVLIPVPEEKLPDLTVINVVVDWDWDTTIKQAKAEIANIGDKDAENIMVYFNAEENPVSPNYRPQLQGSIPSLAIGDSIWLDADFDPLKRSENNYLGNVYKICVIADPKHLIKEKNENNNEMCFTLP